MNAPHKQTRVEAELGRAIVRIAEIEERFARAVSRAGELEEENARLKRLLLPAKGTPKAWGLTYTQERLVLAMELVFPRILTDEAALEMVWPNSFPSKHVISVMICHIRKKIRPHGCNIINVHGRGNRIDQVTADAIRDYDISVDTTDETGHTETTGGGEPNGSGETR